MFKKQNILMLKSFITICFLGMIPLRILVRVIFDIKKYNVDDSAMNYVALMIGYAIMGFIACYLYRDLFKYELKKCGKVFELIKTVIIYSCLFLGFEVIFNYLYSISIGSLNTSNQKIIDAGNGLNFNIYLLCCFARVVAAPIVEEIIFRYILQNWEKNKFKVHGRVISILFTAIIFGILHSGFSKELILYAVPGLLFGMIYNKTNNLLVVIIIHAINNLLSALNI